MDRHRIRGTLIAVGFAAILLPVTEPSEPSSPSSQRKGEGARVTLSLLDVEAYDQQGRPRRGLTRDDFSLRLDGKPWPIYSVDDFCAAGDSRRTASAPPGAAPSPPPAGARAAAPGPAQAPLAEEDVWYILYLDFSQLQLGGRQDASRAAVRWIREIMKPGDRVMVVAYLTTGGTRELCPLTSDKGRLESAVTHAAESKDFTEQFPAYFKDRIQECLDCLRACECVGCEFCCGMCRYYPQEEYSHGRYSLAALRQFVAGLEPLPGRKILVFFHQNGVISPGVFYPVSYSVFRTGDHEKTLEEVGAEATTSRVTLYPITVTGVDDSDEPAALGSRLAEYTGGRSNHGLMDLFDVLRSSRERSDCFYRVAFDPPVAGKRRVHQARVSIAGRESRSFYRVRYMTEDDRLGRRARAAMRGLLDASPLSLSAALVPRSAGQRWSLAVQVALDPSQLLSLPSESVSLSAVDVGALLYREEGKESWDMLTGSELRRHGEATGSRWLLFERTVDDLKPGHYRLSAFARDTTQDLFAGAQASLVLPALDEGGIAGPVALAAGRSYFFTPLPLTRDRLEKPGGTAERREGTLPVGALSVERGQILEMETWLCAPGGTARGEDLSRWITRDAVPVYRMPAGRLEPKGACARFLDRVETKELEPGTYEYHLLWREPEGSATPHPERSVTFEVSSPAT